MFIKPASTATAMIAALMMMAASVVVVMVDAGSTVLSVHGSGTTNPSKCYWAIMEQIMAQTRHPTRLTYRAIGSTTGIEEFVTNNASPAGTVVDFASGDLPLSAQDYNEIVVNQGDEIVQLPVLLGAVNFFHSVPLLLVNKELNMTACLLARIFNRQITTWNDEGIRQLNPNMVLLVDGGGDSGEELPITVARRDKGSSSTDSITNYLHGACPSEWPADMVGPELTNWHAETTICEGSAGMTACLVDIPGAIGYMDAGHGLAADLKEVALEKQTENAAGAISTIFLTSTRAAAENGIAAAENGVFPTTTDVDMSAVSLLNRPGEYTWPIVQMTYIYVRKDLRKVLPNDVSEQALLVAFLTALFGESDENDTPFIQQCIDEYGFTRPSTSVLQLARDGVKMLITNATTTTGNTTTPLFLFESSTMSVEGAGDLVVSVKRAQIADLERASLKEDVDELKIEVPDLSKQLADAIEEIVLLQAQLNQLTGGILGGINGSGTTADEASTPNLRNGEETTGSSNTASSSSTFNGRLFTEQDAGQLKAALIMSSLSFVMWMLFIFYLGYKFCNKP